MIRYLLITCFLLTGLLVKSQAPVADFTVSSTTGCAPLIIDFKDVSTGDPKFWNWDFGNGQLSNKQNPQISYYYPGKYTVTLVVRNANGTNGITKTDFIIVNPSPQAAFTSDYTNVCLPGGVQFTDQSSAGTGTISNWEWNFGDSTTSTQQNPGKTYSATGFYTVTLKVTNSTGCTNTVNRLRYIRVLSGIITAFKDPVAQVCKPPYNLAFINESSGPGNLTYNWDFGNGNTSTANNPSISVATTAPLNVQLIAQSDLGCSDTLKKTITVSSILTSFTSPDSACLNTQVAFQNTSASPLTSNWLFSDGISSAQVNTSRQFAAAGNYNVKLINKYADCTDSLTKTIKILPPPTVDFTSNVPGACKAPLIINFQDISPNAITWLWNFGDGGTSNQKAPSHNYTKEGEYDVSLTITSGIGCTNTITKSKFIRIAPPVVQIANAPASGCAPFTFNAVPGVNAVDGVSSYLWDFGDGAPTSTLQNPSHTYNNPGNYTLKLSIVTTGGCSGTISLVNGITTGLPSVPAFSSDNTQACSDSSIQFKNLSTPTSGLTYLWDFGDGKTSTQLSPPHSYGNPGSYTVSLTTSNNGCLSTITKPSFITVTPPLAKFTYKSNCSTSPTVTFTNNSIIDNTKPVTYAWDFGVPGGTSTAANPVYQFPAKSSYNVRLTVTNGSCANTLVIPVLLSTPTADFSKNTSDNVCRSQNITFQAANTNPQNISLYQWSFDGSPYSAAGSSITTSFSHNGKIPISLAITDLGGCSDTVTKNVTIIGSKADFTAVDTVSCENGIVKFNDLSTPAGSVKQWVFDYGDGTKQTYTSGPFTHQYKTAGSYTVTLTITGKDGCSDVINYDKLVRISKPVAMFLTNDTLICPNGSVQFRDSSNIIKPLSYLWNFGDGTTSTLPNPIHKYSGTDSVYSVSLKISDASGCTDSLSKLRFIKVTSPTSAFSVSDSTTICPPLQTEFLLKGKNYTSFRWDFGDNTTSTLDTPYHFYNDYGRYVAKLFVVGAGGCIDSSEHIINVNNPFTSSLVSYTPLTGCNSVLADFIIIKPANTFYTFYFGDGTTGTPQKDTFQYLYNLPNTYTPYMELGESSGCRVNVGGTTPIKVLGADPFFSPDHKSFCDAGTVYFTNYTIGNDPIVSSVWNFGDGSSSTDKDPVHDYNQPGQYIVSLSVTTQSGCSKTETDTIRVYRTPAPSINADSVVCINSPLLLKAALPFADSSASYNWTLGDGTTSTQVNPSIKYTKEGSYLVNLEVSNALGCKGSASKTITVAPLPVITADKNVVIPVGTGTIMPVTYGPNIKSYNWSPPGGLSCIDCATPIVNPKTTTTYTVSVTDNNGCKNSAEVLATVICNEKNYFVPNTFSPNGDGNNDVFYPRGNNINHIQSMRIFNRWGELIFEKRNFAANNASDGWDGTYKGKAAAVDAYVYIIEFICENGSIIPLKGNVTLIR